MDPYDFDVPSSENILPISSGQESHDDGFEPETALENALKEEETTAETETAPPPPKKRERKQHKRKKAPGAPRRAKSAYIIFFQAHRIEYKAQLPPDSKQADVMRAVAAKWGVMDDDDKKEWHEKAEEEKQRYEAQKAEYDGPMYISKKRRRADPDAPKRAMSAFLHYSQKRRAELKKEHPGATNTELSKMLGQEWTNMADEIKAPFIEKARVENEEYKESMVQYHAQQKLKEDVNSVAANAIAVAAATHQQQMAAAQAQAHQALLESFNANAVQQHAFGGVGSGGVFPGQYSNMGQAWINNAAAAAASYPNMFHEMMQHHQQQAQQQQSQMSHQQQLQQAQQQQQQQQQQAQAAAAAAAAVAGGGLSSAGLSDLMNNAYRQYYQT